jgi:hypothetical protein
MRFYKITNMVKAVNTQKNKQFIMLENRPFLMGALLLKHPKFDQKLIMFVKKLLIKIFNSNNKIFCEMLYTNVITFFNKTELYKLLGLRKDTDIYIEKPLLSKQESNQEIKIINKNIFKISTLDKKVKKCLYLYLYIVKCFFDYIGFPKLINILGKVLSCSLKEKRTNCLKTMLDKLGKIYLTTLKINSLHSLIGLISLFLMLKKILKSIYIME